jgi:gas vesicle protein
MNIPEKKSAQSSHLGVGVLIGAAIGVATAAFLQSKKGRELTTDLQKKVSALQKKIMTELSKAGDMTKEKYEELVDKVVDYYVKSKDIAAKEVPVVKKQLLSTWKQVEKQLKSLQ